MLKQNVDFVQENKAKSNMLKQNVDFVQENKANMSYVDI